MSDILPSPDEFSSQLNNVEPIRELTHETASDWLPERLLSDPAFMKRFHVAIDLGMTFDAAILTPKSIKLALEAGFEQASSHDEAVDKKD